MVKYKSGQCIAIRQNGTFLGHYLIASFGNEISLFCLQDGVAWRLPLEVKSPTRITESEMADIVGVPGATISPVTIKISIA